MRLYQGDTHLKRNSGTQEELRNSRGTQDAILVDNADGADNADDNHQQSHVAASSESWDHCVTQSPIMSTTMGGLPLWENAPISDSSNNTRGPDAAPADNLHGNILDASQEACVEKESCAAAEPVNLSEGEVTMTGSDNLPPCMAAGESSGVADLAQQDHSSTSSRGPETRSHGQFCTHGLKSEYAEKPSPG